MSLWDEVLAACDAKAKNRSIGASRQKIVRDYSGESEGINHQGVM
jgi:hypothetical protein